jgi:hypothetical protein
MTWSGAGGQRNRTGSIALVGGVLIAAVLVYLIATRQRHPVSPPAAAPAARVDAPSGAATTAEITSRPHLLFRSSHMDGTYGQLAVTDLHSPGQRIAVSPLACDRVAFAGGAGICLSAARGVDTTYAASLFDAAFRKKASLTLPGEPSRARVSSDGRFGAYTVFVAGLPHGYTVAGFSTATVLVDMARAVPIGNLEEFATTRDGHRFKAADFNFWGVTFAKDSNIFFATLQTGGTIFLVRGNISRRTMTVLTEGVECPSLSPDGTLIAFKQRVAAAPVRWRLRVLDLATMRERPVAGESRSVDDQVEWLDPSHILYAIERPNQPVRDVWVASVADATPARVFLPEAESPSVVDAVPTSR